MANFIDVRNFAPHNSIYNVGYRPVGDAMQISNVGDVAYGSALNFTDFSFSLAMGEGAHIARFLFSKSRRDSFIAQRLSYDDTNYGYGVSLCADGTVSIIKTTVGDEVLPLSEASLPAPLTDGAYHRVTVTRTLQGERISLSLSVDGVTLCAAEEPYDDTLYPMMGHIAFSHTKNHGSYLVRDISYEGIENDTAKSLPADAMNLCTVFGMEGEMVLFAAFNSASSTTKWAEVYAAEANGDRGALLGCIYAPETTLSLGDYKGDGVYVVSVGFTEENSTCEYVPCHKDYKTFDPDTVSPIAIAPAEAGEAHARFIYRDTGKPYLPMGGNWMGLRGGDHSTFDAATALTDADYNPLRAEALLRALSENGGNVVRVFLVGRSDMNPGVSGDRSIPVDNAAYYYEGLYRPYMENFVHFLRTAQKYGVYVMPALGDGEVPANAYYRALQGGGDLCKNRLFLTKEGISARTAFVRNILSYLKRYAPDAISGLFCMQFQNEFAIESNLWPFHMETGVVTLANGVTYDMGDPDARERAFREGVRYYLNAMNAAVKAELPHLLTAEGTFTRNIVGNNHIYGMMGMNDGKHDYRLPPTIEEYLSSDIDFLDMHVYHANGLVTSQADSYAADLTYMKYHTEETRALLKKKCIFMGEFGAYHFLAANGAEAAEHAKTTVRLAKETDLQGFAVWTLDSHNQTSCWNILSRNGKWDDFRDLVEIMNG